MAQAFAQMILKAYDALLHFGINYRALPEYQDQKLLKEAEGLVITEGRNRYLLWMERMGHGIDAAVRRKQFKLHVNTTKEPSEPT